MIEVDEYHQKLDGVIRMECEFHSEEHAGEFKLPEWAADAVEVTHDSRYKNRNLAVNGLPALAFDE